MSASVRFDKVGARQVLTDAPDGSSLQLIRDAAHAAGLDPVASLYNEALSLAEEGHFGQAQIRLHVLLGLAPSDGDAHLLLAKIYVAGQQWRRALAALDDAAQCGTAVPGDLRAAVVRLLQADETTPAPTEGQGDDRSRAEVTSLKGETRRLRSENAHLLTTNRQLQAETARWAWIAVGTSTVAILLLLTRSLFGAPVDASEVVEPAPEVAEVVGEEVVPVRNADAAAVAKATLESAEGLEGTELEVVVRGGHAELSGKSPTFAQVREAVRLLGDVEGINEVGHSSVKVLARTKGARHVVASGDTLSKLAWDYYGDETRHAVILDANKVLEGNPSRLKIGMELIIPPLPAE